jgi:hypothetical protein
MPAWYQIVANVISITAIILITAHPSEKEALASAKRR